MAGIEPNDMQYLHGLIGPVDSVPVVIQTGNPTEVTRTGVT